MGLNRNQKKGRQHFLNLSRIRNSTPSPSGGIVVLVPKSKRKKRRKREKVRKSKQQDLDWKPWLTEKTKKGAWEKSTCFFLLFFLSPFQSAIGHGIYPSPVSRAELPTIMSPLSEEGRPTGLLSRLLFTSFFGIRGRSCVDIVLHASALYSWYYTVHGWIICSHVLQWHYNHIIEEAEDTNYV